MQVKPPDQPNHAKRTLLVLLAVFLTVFVLLLSSTSAQFLAVKTTKNSLNGRGNGTVPLEPLYRHEPAEVENGPHPQIPLPFPPPLPPQPPQQLPPLPPPMHTIAQPKETKIDQLKTKVVTPRPPPTPVVHFDKDVYCTSDDTAEISNTSRPSFGTGVRLPPVHFEEMHTEGKTPLGSICIGKDSPLHLALVLSPHTAESEEPNPEKVPSLAAQVAVLAGEAPKSLVSNVLVTVLAEVLPPRADGTRRVVLALLHFDASDRPARVLGWHAAAARKDAAWSAVVAELHKTGQLDSKFRSVPTPHFLLPLPVDTLMTPGNLRGLCYLDTVINDESETTSVYPFAAEPFVPVGRIGARNGRLAVGFVRVASGQATLVSTCRPPVALSEAQRVVEGGHYSKGGDMVMRGFLWVLDVGSAMERAGPSAVPRRAVLVPFMAGVHGDLMLATPEGGGLAPAHTNGQRMAVFTPRRKVVDSHCSTDPKDPVRVSTHMALYVNSNTDELRNGFDVFVRVINATALMTGFSDLTISTNCPADLLLKYLRAEVRGLEVRAFLSDPSLDDSGKGLRFLDTSYGNPFGELVIMTQHKQSSGSWYALTGNTHFPIMSQLGFFDLVRYTEDDVYLSRDQFEFYCATLPFFEARDEFLNQIRWEAPWDELDEGSPQPVHKMNNRYNYRRVYVNVLQSNMATHVTFGDKRMKDGWSWRNDKQAFGINLTLKAQQTQKADDRSRNTVSYPVPPTPLSYEVDIVPLKSCRFQGNASTHLRSATEANVAGCYTIAYTHHGGWNRNDVYNAMWILPTHRVQLHYLGGSRGAEEEKIAQKSSKWRGFDNRIDLNDRKFPFNRNSVGGLYREGIVYFGETPLNSYRNGGIFMLYMEEGEGLDAYKSREEGGADYGKEQGYYGLHRFGGLNHGRNEQPNQDGETPDGHPRFKLPDH